MPLGSSNGHVYDTIIPNTRRLAGRKATYDTGNRVRQSASPSSSSSSTANRNSSSKRSSDDESDFSCRAALSCEDDCLRRRDQADDWWRFSPSLQTPNLTPLKQKTLGLVIVFLTPLDSRLYRFSWLHRILTPPEFDSTGICLANKRKTITHSVATQRLATVMLGWLEGTPFCLIMHLQKSNGLWKKIRQNWWWKKCEPRTSLIHRSEAATDC